MPTVSPSATDWGQQYPVTVSYAIAGPYVRRDLVWTRQRLLSNQ